jgi:hypothetical protein
MSFHHFSAAVSFVFMSAILPAYRFMPKRTFPLLEVVA